MKHRTKAIEYVKRQLDLTDEPLLHHWLAAMNGHIILTVTYPDYLHTDCYTLGISHEINFSLEDGQPINIEDYENICKLLDIK